MFCPLINDECHGKNCILFVNENRTGNSNCRLESATVGLESIGEYFAKQLDKDED